MKLPAASCTLAKPRRGIFTSFALDYFGNQRFSKPSLAETPQQS